MEENSRFHGKKKRFQVRQIPLLIQLNVDVFILHICWNNFLASWRKLSCLLSISMKQQMFQKRLSRFCVVGLPIRKQKPLASCAVLTLEFAQLLKPSSPNWSSSLKIMDLIGWSIRQLLPSEQQRCNALLMELSEKSKTFPLTLFQPIFWRYLSVTDRSFFKWLKKRRSVWSQCHFQSYKIKIWPKIFKLFWKNDRNVSAKINLGFNSLHH